MLTPEGLRRVIGRPGRTHAMPCTGTTPRTGTTACLVLTHRVPRLGRYEQAHLRGGRAHGAVGSDRRRRAVVFPAGAAGLVGVGCRLRAEPTGVEPTRQGVLGQGRQGVGACLVACAVVVLAVARRVERAGEHVTRERVEEPLERGPAWTVAQREVPRAACVLSLVLRPVRVVLRDQRRDVPGELPCVGLLRELDELLLRPLVGEHARDLVARTGERLAEHVEVPAGHGVLGHRHADERQPVHRVGRGDLPGRGEPRRPRQPCPGVHERPLAPCASSRRVLREEDRPPRGGDEARRLVQRSHDARARRPVPRPGVARPLGDRAQLLRDLVERREHVRRRGGARQGTPHRHGLRLEHVFDDTQPGRTAPPPVHTSGTGGAPRTARPGPARLFARTPAAA